MGCPWWEFLAVNPAHISALLIWKGLTTWGTRSFDSSSEFTQKKMLKQESSWDIAISGKRSRINLDRKGKKGNYFFRTCDVHVLLCVCLPNACSTNRKWCYNDVKNRLLLVKLTTSQNKNSSIQGLATFTSVFWTKLVMMDSGYFLLWNTGGSIRYVLSGRDSQRSPATSCPSPWTGSVEPQTREMLLGEERVVNV